MSFQVVNWVSNSSKNSFIMTKSFAYNSSHGYPRQQSWDNASITIRNSKGLRNEPWWNPTLTPSFSLKLFFIWTVDAASAYIAWTNLIFRTSIPSALCWKPFRVYDSKKELIMFSEILHLIDVMMLLMTRSTNFMTWSNSFSPQ